MIEVEVGSYEGELGGVRLQARNGENVRATLRTILTSSTTNTGYVSKNRRKNILGDAESGKFIEIVSAHLTSFLSKCRATFPLPLLIIRPVYKEFCTHIRASGNNFTGVKAHCVGLHIKDYEVPLLSTNVRTNLCPRAC
jgi:hypothetical protein